ncbi:methylthioribulose 1-phosphate dehydratase [Brasilonema octagenarum]|uniref:Methylthioribulose-1-phosphate dehydratase n=1 Tax=Brasilonema octagenarum UFV-OR1 TaxID=417115 RepID=A0ABX1MB63_9CYAN|nr:methylthioribulose 1-phosphate dehydratase [Brasilonema octagenarum]NMF65001.1 methylthioribulose 1-phosphate dehydratase [Brasilonema octagenarum UFV-OR1]
MNSPKLIDPRLELICAARHFYQQGWMVGTSGNLSVRLPDHSFWITASGQCKGELELGDFVRIYPNGTACPEGSRRVEKPSPDVKPSAETAIHQVLYALFPEATSCYHVHSVEANLVSRFVKGDTLPLPPLEMLKGLGVWEENPDCAMSIFDNHLQVSCIVDEIKERFRTSPPQLRALLIRDHGVTIWAPSAKTARNDIELVEYIFRYMVAARGVGVWGVGEERD